jgi:serine/threonine protein kinase
MSLEQAKGKAVDRRSNIWSFGAVLFELLRGKRAFPGESTTEILAMVLKVDTRRNAHVSFRLAGGPGHNWANGVSMATPIAHKGAVAGAKSAGDDNARHSVHSELVQKARDYYNNMQTKDIKSKSFLRADDKPAIWLNQKTIDGFRPRMKALYYDPPKFGSYLEQLGIRYPTLRTQP